MKGSCVKELFYQCWPCPFPNLKKKMSIGCSVRELDWDVLGSLRPRDSTKTYMLLGIQTLRLLEVHIITFSSRYCTFGRGPVSSSSLPSDPSSLYRGLKETTFLWLLLTMGKGQFSHLGYMKVGGGELGRGVPVCMVCPLHPIVKWTVLRFPNSRDGTGIRRGNWRIPFLTNDYKGRRGKPWTWLTTSTLILTRGCTAIRRVLRPSLTWGGGIWIYPP